MLALKILGMVDIITAFALFMNLNLLFLTVPLFIIHLIKGLMSFGADWVGKLYGTVDLLSSVALLFIFDYPLFEGLLIIVLLFKGITSLM